MSSKSGGRGCCFFFQAEDGIRDWSVTGVQTCALPIWETRGFRVTAGPRTRAAPGANPRAGTACSKVRRVATTAISAPPTAAATSASPSRSEERRVGEEGRERGGRGRGKREQRERGTRT